MDSNNSYISQLKDRLRDVQSLFVAFLQTRQFERYEKKSNPFASLGTNPPRGPEISFRLTQLSPKQEREQNKIFSIFDMWQSDASGLLEYFSRDRELQLSSLVRDLDVCLRYPKISRSQKSFNEAIESLGVICDKIVKVLDDIESTGKSTPLFVIDTSAVLDCPDISQMTSLLNLSKSILVIPSTTVKELEDLKSSRRDEAFRRKLTAAIKNINEIIANGDALEGVKLPDGTTLKMLASEPDFSNLPKWLDPKINDDRILAAALELQRSNPLSDITLIANDLSMQNKATLAKISVKKGPNLFEDAA